MPFRVALLLVLFGVPLLAQQPVAEPPNPPQKTIGDMVSEQFGAAFKVDPKFAPLTVDLDSDGAQDLVVVAFGKNPLGQTEAMGYKVLDPYDGYFGFGDPKVTTKFSDFGDGTSHCVLILHDFRAAKPKAKFVIVNLPFEKLALGTTPFKKRTVAAISATEEGGLNAVVFWDGKKYRWEPTDFSSDTAQVDLNAK